MDSCISVLSNIKTCIETIISEMESFDAIQKLNFEQFPVYSNAMAALQISIKKLHEVFILEIPTKHNLKFAFIDILQIEINNFKEVLAECKIWSDNATNNQCFYLYRCSFMALNPPSIMEKKIEDVFEKIKPLLKELDELEKNIFGSAIEIKHPILQKAWMLVGANQLNETFLPADTIIQGLFFLLKKEENGTLKKEDYCKKMIEEFIKLIDSSAGTPPDNKITLLELNQIEITEENKLSVKKLLGIQKQPDEIIITEISTEFKEPIKVLFNHPVEIPNCEGYGANWPSKKACEFIVSAENINNLDFFGIDFEINAGDQGWGGTGHDQVRFQVNDIMPQVAFSIWRDKVPDGNYKFNIGPDKVKLGDTVKLWLCSAPWGGWDARMNSCKAFLKFA